VERLANGWSHVDQWVSHTCIKDQLVPHIHNFLFRVSKLSHVFELTSTTKSGFNMFASGSWKATIRGIPTSNNQHRRLLVADDHYFWVNRPVYLQPAPSRWGQSLAWMPGAPSCLCFELVWICGFSPYVAILSIFVWFPGCHGKICRKSKFSMGKTRVSTADCPSNPQTITSPANETWACTVQG
jgi:hypothetical protein